MEMGLLSPSTIDRGADIERIVSTISELSEVFKSLNALVIDQGTLVDRIDYNIDRTYTFV
jgi:syntaxin 16